MGPRLWGQESATQPSTAGESLQDVINKHQPEIAAFWRATQVCTMHQHQTHPTAQLIKGVLPDHAINPASLDLNGARLVWNPRLLPGPSFKDSCPNPKGLPPQLTSLPAVSLSPCTPRLAALKCFTSGPFNPHVFFAGAPDFEDR